MRGDALDQMKDRSSKTKAAKKTKQLAPPVTRGATLNPAPTPTQAPATRSQVIFRRLVRAVGFGSAPDAPEGRQTDPTRRSAGSGRE